MQKSTTQLTNTVKQLIYLAVLLIVLVNCQTTEEQPHVETAPDTQNTSESIAPTAEISATSTPTDLPTIPPNTPTPTDTPYPTETPISRDSITEGIWDFQISPYQQMGSDGLIQEFSGSASVYYYTMQLRMSETLVGGKILGVSGNACHESSIQGSREGNQIGFIITHTGSCCGSAQSAFIGTLDPDTNTITGQLEPVGIPPGSCTQWFSNVTGQIREPFLTPEEFLARTSSETQPTYFADGIWDFQVTVHYRLLSNALIIEEAGYSDMVMELVVEDSIISGRQIGASNGACSNATLNGIVDGQTVKMIYTNVGSCCGGSVSYLTGTIEEDGISFVGEIEPGGFPAQNCRSWYGNIVAFKR